MLGKELSVAGVLFVDSKDCSGDLTSGHWLRRIPQFAENGSCQFARTEQNLTLLARHLRIEVAGITKGSKNPVNGADIVFYLRESVTDTLSLIEKVGALREQTVDGMLKRVGSGTFYRIVHAGNYTSTI